MQIHGQYIKLEDGYQLHVVTSGPESAPPLLMLHCWAGNWTEWERTMRHLDGKFRFIVPDQLGSGGSQKPAGDYYQIDKQANRAYQVLRHFGYEHAPVIGHSMGGMIALTLAGMYPDAVDKLVVVAPAVTGRIHPISNLLAPVLALGRINIIQPLELAIYLAEHFLLLGKLVAKAFFADPHEYWDEAHYGIHQIVADGQKYSSVWAEKAIQEWDTTPLLAHINATTIAIWGELDFTIPVSECDILQQQISDFDAIRVSNVGHFPMIETWDTYIDTVENFLLLSE